MADYDVKAILSAKDTNFSSTMNDAIKALEQLDSSTDTTSTSATKMGAAFGVVSAAISAAFSAISSSMSSAIARFDTLNQFPKVMEQIGFSAEDAAAASEKLVEGIQGLPTSLDEITANAQSIALLTGDLDEATDIAIALNDAFLASGSSSYEASRGLAQYSQMLASGTVDMQSWRVLLETMGVALNDVAAEFGYTGASAKNDLYAALKSGEITFDELNATLINLDNGLSTASDSFVAFSERALTGSEGIATSFQNIKTAITTGLANMLTAIDTALGDAGLGSIASNLDSIKYAVKSAFATINSVVSSTVNTIAPIIKKVADNMDLVAVAAAALAAKFTALKVIDTIKSKMESFKTATKSAYSTISEYNTALEKFGSKAKAAKAAEEALTKAKETANKASQAQISAEQALITYKEAYVAQLKAEYEAEQAAQKYGKESAEAAQAQTAAKEAAAVASQAKTAALEKEATAEALTAEATQAATVAEETGAAASTLNNTQISLKTALLSVLSGETTVATACQEAFNAALAANPIGLVITAITTLISVISVLGVLFDDAATEADELAEAQQEVYDSVTDTTKALKKSSTEHKNNIAVAKQAATAESALVDEIEALQQEVTAVNATGADASSLTEQITAKVAELNTMLGDSVYSYDAQSNALSATTEAMKAYIEQSARQSELAEYTDAATEAFDAMTEATKAQEDALAEAEAAQEAYDIALAEFKANGATDAMGTYSTAVQEAAEEVERTTANLDAMNEAVDTATEEYNEDCELMAQATAELEAEEEAAFNAMVEDVGMVAASMTNLTDAQETALGRITDAYGTMVAGLSDLTNVLVENDDRAVSEILGTQDEVIAQTTEFADLYAQLIEAGLSESWLNAIGITDATSIPAMQNLIQELMGSGKDEILAAQDEWLEAYETIGSTLTSALQMTDQDRAAIQEYITGETGVYGSMSDAIKEAEWDTLATEAMTGFATSMESATETTVVPAAEQVAETTATTIAESGTEAYEAAGETQMQAYATSIESNSGLVTDAVESVTAEVGNTLEAEDFSPYGEAIIADIQSGVQSTQANLISALKTVLEQAKAAFDSITTDFTAIGTKAITGLMDGVESLTSAVTQQMQNLYDGLKAIFDPVAEDFKTFGNTAMQSFIDAMNALIGTVNATAVNAANAAKEGVTISFESQGKDAMQGFIDGMEAKRSSVMTTARSIANAASTTIADALDVGSPSKLLKKYGKWTGEGFEIGLKSMVGSVEKAASKLANAVVSICEPDTSGYTAGVQLAMAGGSTYGYDVLADDIANLTEAINSRPIQIETNLEIDGREFAKSTSEYISDEIDKSQARASRKSGTR